MLAVAAKVLATPAVRRLCRDMSVDLSLEPISGTGPGGRVLKGDVLAYAAKNSATRRGSPQTSAGAVAKNEGAGNQPREAGHHDLSAWRDLAETPDMVLVDHADRPGSLSEPAGDWSPESSGEGRRATTTIDRGEEVAAAGVQVAEEEEEEEEEEERWTQPEKEARRPSGSRERKEPVSVPIRGEIGVGCLCCPLGRSRCDRRSGDTLKPYSG